MDRQEGLGFRTLAALRCGWEVTRGLPQQLACADQPMYGEGSFYTRMAVGSETLCDLPHVILAAKLRKISSLSARSIGMAFGRNVPGISPWKADRHS